MLFPDQLTLAGKGIVSGFIYGLTGVVRKPIEGMSLSLVELKIKMLLNMLQMMIVLLGKMKIVNTDRRACSRVLEKAVLASSQNQWAPYSTASHSHLRASNDSLNRALNA